MAIFSTEAGTIRNYKHCAFQIKAGVNSCHSIQPMQEIGEPAKEETVEEYQIEILCADEENTTDAARELTKVHPHEEVAYEVL
jgi:hypothetical protein